jgi:peptidoglycan/LPS O-acetylase OafA/YrhL
VEEQFYLAWPLIVLSASARRLPWIFAGAALLAIVTRVSILALGGGWAASQLPTPCSFDALGLGALLAWHRHANPFAHARRTTLVDRCLLAGSVLLALSIGAAVVGVPFAPRVAIEAPAASLIALWLVERGARGMAGHAGAVLNARPVRYVGRISYGIYLAQTPIRYGLGKTLHLEGSRDGTVALFFAVAMLSVLAAALSWRYLEAPISAFKARVPYPGSA